MTNLITDDHKSCRYTWFTFIFPT